MSDNKIISNENRSGQKILTPMFWITCLVCLLPIAIGFILYDKLPRDIPQQYGFNGEINWTLPKPWGFIVCPLIILACHIFILIGTSIAMKSDTNKKVKILLQWLLPVIGLPINIMMILVPAGIDIDVFIVCALVISVLFIVLGNYLPKVERNSFLGVRAPWTRKNDVVWAKNQRFGGKVFVILGFVILLTIFLPAAKYIFIGCIVLSFLLLLIYSLAICNKYKDE